MAKISIKGTIVNDDDKWIYDLFEITAVCPKDIETGLNAAGDQAITVEVNSGGGDLFAGSEIYYLLNRHKGQVIADIVGFAGSAATIACCGANKVRAVPSALYMIHNVRSGADGDYHAMDQQSSVLKTANKSIANAYQLKTGLSEKELLSLMDKESWMDAKEALEKGFIDEIIGESQQPALYNAAFNAVVLSPETLQKVRNTLNNQKINPSHNEPDFFITQKQAALKLLKLKGEMRHV